MPTLSKEGLERPSDDQIFLAIFEVLDLLWEESELPKSLLSKQTIQLGKLAREYLNKNTKEEA